MITLKINGKVCETAEGSTILDVAREQGVRIPTLCYLKDYTAGSACRMCLVEVQGMKSPVTACNTRASEGMEINTESDSIRKLRRQNLELIASNHRMDCTFCSSFPYCELNSLMREHGLDDRTYRYSRTEEFDRSAEHLTRDNSKCILCGRCVAACKKQTVRAVDFTGRGSNTRVTPGAAGLPLSQTACIGCGQCIMACPVGALREKDDTQVVLNELHHKLRPVWFILTPEVGKTFGKCMQDGTDSDVTGKVVTLLRKLGADKVFTMDRFADMAIAAEQQELGERKKTGGSLPLISSRCPAVENLIKKSYPTIASLLSTNVKKQELFASMARERCENAFVVIIGTCTAAKTAGYNNVDAVLTVRELSSMYRKSCVSDFTAVSVWRKLIESAADTASDKSGEETDAVTAYNAESLAELRKILDELAAGNKNDMEYITCSACPGGCAHGGGSPRMYKE